MATPLHPGFHFIEHGGPRLSPREAQRYARRWGLPQHAIPQIGHGESDGYAFVQQHDPGDGMVGYGYLQLTPNAWGKSSRAYRLLQRMGGIGALADPKRGIDRQFRLARVLYKDAGNSLSPWHGTRYLTDRSGEGTLGPINGHVRVRGGGGGGSSAQAASGPGIGSLADELGALGLPDVSSLLPQRQGPPISGPAELAFSARARLPMPNGAQVSLSSGPPAPKLDVLSLLKRAAQQQGGPGLTALTGGGGGGGASAPAGSGGGGSAGGSPTGDVTLAAGADRAGAHTRPHVLHFLEHVAGIAGEPISIGTGTDHNQFVAGTNRESDHWTGRAADVPAAGQQLIHLGRSALIAAGMSRARARKINGGLFNLTYRGRRVQIIFNTQEGGDHTDHLHVGLSAPR